MPVGGDPEKFPKKLQKSRISLDIAPLGSVKEGIEKYNQFLTALAQFDTPTVANAIEVFGIRDSAEGYLRGGIHACFPELPPIVGFASTIAQRGLFPKPPSVQGNSVEDQVESFASLPGPPIVVIEDLDASLASAAFGEMMCSTYQRFGAQGLITNGWGRDLLQVRKRKFPVFTSGDCCSHAYSHLLNLGLPVNLCGVAVRQGDLLHADANGVLLIPMDILSELPEVARRLVAAEQILLDFIDTGSADTTQLRAVKKEVIHQLTMLEAEVRGRRAAGKGNPPAGPTRFGDMRSTTNL